MADIRSIEIAGVVISALLSTGALTFFIKYSTRLALVERMVDQSKLETLHPRLSMMETAVQEIKSALVELKHLPRISAQLEGLQDVMKVVVPRYEHEAHWRAEADRFDAIDRDIQNLKNNK